MTTSDNEWQRMRTSDKSSDNELQQKTTRNNEWQRMTNNENEIQRVTGTGITNEKGWEQKNRVILSFKVKQIWNALVPEEFYSIFLCNV